MIEPDIGTAARIYCRLKGINPDESVEIEPPRSSSGLEPMYGKIMKPRWQVVAEEMQDLCLKLQAIEEAKE